ncbi:hypothetical protein BN971_03638 [Mycobacterium bohemicum DSM 44277]|uniref:SRPBCC family protein n=2 Tax=Mycobacterium bohemicum TaxID=56425 RepID=A0A1X1R355_MYCBE|nr:hypothetical protein [Mycobacterium bohemicum]MCV6970352.1 SRPBCC family protein [Mycobacterium bohemicum]ORU98701.1 hypothetical protein AWB93_12640 [Mycobacterium bohemicum]CPR12344.1 hypothetical protein BN971_03638 [Mycobacterium bohemicum DSM 44277]
MANVTRRMTRAAAVLAVLYAARRYYRNWGATKAECQMPMPGDELIAEPALQTTEAVYVDAPVSAVWPWLVRLGRGERDLEVGDEVRPAAGGRLPDGLTLRVAEIVPEKYLVLTAGRPGHRWNIMWSLHIQPHWEDRVRLLTRARIALRHPGEVFLAELVRPGIALGTRGLLLGIKHRVERPSRWASSAEQPTAGTR